MIGFNGFAQRCPRTDNFFLTKEMVKVHRSHPVSQRLESTVHETLVIPYVIAEQVHEENIRSGYPVDNHNVRSTALARYFSKLGRRFRGCLRRSFIVLACATTR